VGISAEHNDTTLSSLSPLRNIQMLENSDNTWPSNAHWF